MGKVLSSFQTFRCMHNFNLRLPILHDGASKFQALSDVLHHAISLHAKELLDAKALIDGKLVLDNEPCSSDGVHEVELLIPFLNNSSIEAYNQKDVSGIFSFSGTICSFAHLNSKEPISQAVTDIKGDIIMSLQRPPHKERLLQVECRLETLPELSQIAVTGTPLLIFLFLFLPFEFFYNLQKYVVLYLANDSFCSTLLSGSYNALCFIFILFM
ncbi:uncharacterized protein LOC131626477 [Vicia villosa]|uniref:uncharacterized protein LOC131626477 n=1 Tax=Vicia villosa TaxID=3911 RepID=UPI00273AE32D|nr:uncharacterized protein LOC131626477 [Vicia villosa]XP_058753271.1 uncharacterized protein LOC131626477 [Vicia villosa]XP_058753272.1 uncharacterized protein LOC131626477 [Vicia villosa]XP_058753273.1 uncharacterized protein LOC131626477 [Vicia villosa]XP_058753274.1 uncharacterized protein LOC131626477 [Vicia villosa]XP_058753275.1 uncharacterized protein LOC131626477 [Vicia villosa]